MTGKKEELPKDEADQNVYEFANRTGLVIGTTEANTPDNRCPHKKHPGTCDQCK